jgi:hypothetical protein
MVQALPTQESIHAIAQPIIQSIKESGQYQEAIAQSVADKILETAEETAAQASEIIKDFNFAGDILKAFQEGGFSETLQGRLDSLGAIGEIVSLRLELALVIHANELAKLKSEAEKTLEIEVEAKKMATEARFEIKRNTMLTQMSWILNIFSLWPVLVLVLTSMSIGAIGGAILINSSTSQIDTGNR